MAQIRSADRVWCGRGRGMFTAILGVLLMASALPASGVVQWGGNLSDDADRVEPKRLDPGVAERLLTAYDTGHYADFDQLASRFTSSPINPFEFEVEAERWIDAVPDRRRRAFVAAAVAIELAATPPPRPSSEIFRPEEKVALDMRFILAELGCAWLRDLPPSPAERFWHTAFVALARVTHREGYVIPIPSSSPAIWWAPLTGLSEGEIRQWSFALSEATERWKPGGGISSGIS